MRLTGEGIYFPKMIKILKSKKAELKESTMFALFIPLLVGVVFLPIIIQMIVDSTGFSGVEKTFLSIITVIIIISLVLIPLKVITKK